ncbi:hypothetical protein [Massilia scottii]|nr:hypothetical protein [Massilia sp. CCM 9029]MDQ1834781.1 hypothetical protein [Massilia sp. CCM 9029]
MKQYNGLAFTGEHQVRWGVGISILVRFVNEGDIHFTTAGADLTI